MMIPFSQVYKQGPQEIAGGQEHSAAHVCVVCMRQPGTSQHDRGVILTHLPRPQPALSEGAISA